MPAAYLAPEPRRKITGSTDSIVRDHLKHWGKQYRRIELGGYRHSSGYWHFDGWPSSSPSWRLMRYGAGGNQEQHFLEVFDEKGLLVCRAIADIREEWRRALIMYYPGELTPSRAARDMGISKTSFEVLRIAGEACVETWLRVHKVPDSPEQ